MNNIKRHYPFDRYSSVNRPEDFIDLEGAKEQTKSKTDNKQPVKASLPCKKYTSSKKIYNEDMWIIG